MRILVWFSAGAASAVAAKLTLADHGHEDTVLAYVDPGSEHPDNERFIDDCQAWFDHPVERLRSDRYRDTWQVWEERRFIVSPKGALCTAELKKKVRFGFERPDDIQVFGYTTEERKRADRFREQNPGVELSCPLIDRDLTKNDCLAMVARAGIELPAMYKMGYRNNNCIGCPKGGMGYWNKIRDDFPAVYDRMSRLERELGHSVLSDDAGPVWLDQMARSRGDYPTEMAADCSLLCVIAEADIEGSS